MYVRRAPRSGLGTILLDPGAVNNWLREFWEYNRPSGWAKSFADAYQWLHYGNIPDPTIPTPGAPQTIEEMTLPGGWTPAAAAARGQADWIARNQAQLIAAERSGEWIPGGRLPISATELADLTSKYKWPLLIGAGVLGFVVVRAVARR